MSKTRTFIAIEASRPVCKKAAALMKLLGRELEGINWVDDNKLHITLQFLGDVEDTMLAEVCQLTQEAVAEVSPFEICVAGVGAFPEVSRPKSLWLGVSEGAAEIIALHQAVQDALSSLPTKRERRGYTPHLTLGRVLASKESLETLQPRLVGQEAFDAGNMVVDEITIFASELRKSGPQHHVISRAQLG